MTHTSPLYASRRLKVTETLLASPRQTFVLRDLDHVECRRPLFAASLPVAIGAAAIAVRFADLLHPHELHHLVGWPAALTMIASQIGVLRLHSLSIRNEAVWGVFHELKRVRRAVEGAMRARHSQSVNAADAVIPAHEEI